MAGRSATGDSLQTATYTLSNPTSWHHVLGVLDYPNDQIKIYVDGLLVKTQSVNFANSVYTAGTPTTNYDTLGAFKTVSQGDFYHGLIDDVRIYNYPLTSIQVKEVMNFGSVNFR